MDLFDDAPIYSGETYEQCRSCLEFSFNNSYSENCGFYIINKQNKKLYIKINKIGYAKNYKIGYARKLLNDVRVQTGPVHFETLNKDELLNQYQQFLDYLYTHKLITAKYPHRYFLYKLINTNGKLLIYKKTKYVEWKIKYKENLEEIWNDFIKNNNVEWKIKYKEEIWNDFIKFNKCTVVDTSALKFREIK